MSLGYTCEKMGEILGVTRKTIESLEAKELKGVPIPLSKNLCLTLFLENHPEFNKTFILILSKHNDRLILVDVVSKEYFYHYQNKGCGIGIIQSLAVRKENGFPTPYIQNITFEIEDNPHILPFINLGGFPNAKDSEGSGND